MITTVLIFTDSAGAQHFNVFSDGVQIGTNIVAPSDPDTTIENNLAAHLIQIESWISANPTGAILTAAQTLWLAQSLAALCRLILNQTSTIGQAN